MKRNLGMAATAVMLVAAVLVGSATAGKQRTFTGPVGPSPVGTWQGKFSGYLYQLNQEVKKVKRKGTITFIIGTGSDPQFPGQVILTDTEAGEIFNNASFSLRVGNATFGVSSGNDYVTGHLNKKGTSLKGQVFSGTSGGEFVSEFKYSAKKVEP